MLTQTGNGKIEVQVWKALTGRVNGPPAEATLPSAALHSGCHASISLPSIECFHVPDTALGKKQ